MSKDTYNGWTNYATWKVNLEWFDGDMDPRDWGGTVFDVAQGLKDHVRDCIRAQQDMVSDSRVVDYALDFVSDVNWKEIAEHMLDACHLQMESY